MSQSSVQEKNQTPVSKKEQKILDWCIQRAPGRERIPELLHGLKQSYSLNYEEKARVLRKLPDLSQFQVDALIQVFTEEKQKFRDLSKDHPEDVKKLSKKTRKEWKVLSREILRLVKGQSSVKRVSKPSKLLRKLQSRVIGQLHAQEQIVVAFYYQALMALVDQDSLLLDPGRDENEEPYRQPPLLLAGPTGCGKTHLMREAVKLLDLNLVIIDASTLVREGIVGTSVSDIAIQIQEQAKYDMKRACTSVVVLDEFDKLLQEDASGQNRAILNQLLTLLEGTVPLRIDPHNKGERRNPRLALELPTDRLLFVLAGAFEEMRAAQTRQGIGFVHSKQQGHEIDDNSLENGGIPPELRGRLGGVINLDPLSAHQLVEILHMVPHSPLVRLHRELALFDSDVEVDDALLLQMAEQSLESGLGARGLFQSFNMMPSVRRLRLTVPSAANRGIRHYRICSADAESGLIVGQEDAHAA